jgi:glycerophosphoryl diester phosphodiesterase
MRPVALLVSVVATLAAAAPRTAEGPLVIAHRGASFDAPEHTFAAWDLALAQGADVIEQDLQLTADGVLVVLHDDSLARTVRGPGCTGTVRERTWAELQGCDAGSWFNERYPDRATPEYAGLRLPTLDAVFARYGDRVRYHIETKSPEAAPGMEDSLLALVDRHGLRGHARAGGMFLQSFSAASLQRLRALDSALVLVQLLGTRLPDAPLPLTMATIAGYAQGVGPSARTVDSAFLAAARGAGLMVHPYTVNDPAEMRRLLDLGVDGMFTDRPGVLDSLRRGR